VDFQGIYVVSDALRRRLPPSGDVIAEAFLPAIRSGERIAAFVTGVDLIDIGTLRAYLDANLRWLASLQRSSWLGDGAVVDPGAELAQVLVGAGARVEGVGRLERCVVWPGATARAPLADAVVAIEGTVSVAAEGSAH
jgi:NDP-sugar pyrophosphorylase family protein